MKTYRVTIEIRQNSKVVSQITRVIKTDNRPIKGRQQRSGSIIEEITNVEIIE